jgi:diguanylate cyclase (GGDEF)-like protein
VGQFDDTSPPSSAVLLEILRAQTEIMKLGLDLGGVMAFVTDRAQHLTGATGAVVELAEGEEMVYRSTSGVAAGLLGLRLKRQGSLSGLCVERGTILQCDDSESDPRVDRDACRRVGLRSMIVTPLRHLGDTVGVLKVTSPVPGAFADEDVRVLELMTDLIAAAIFHAARNETDALYLQATHDSLTGLPNRALFYDRLRQSLHLAERSTDMLGILNVDMDGLKPINDRRGHRAGDAAIKEAALRMQKAIRLSDTVARIGGDEFALILPGIRTRTDAEAQRDRLAARVRAPFAFEGHDVDLSVSVGVAVFPEDGTEMTALLEHADQAMYDDKRARKRERSGLEAATLR